MGVLANAKWELFAQEIAKGIGVVEAYANAGYAPNDGNGSTLAAKDEVKARIKEIKEGIAQAVADALVLDRTKLLAELAKIANADVDLAGIKPSDKRAAL